MEAIDLNKVRVQLNDIGLTIFCRVLSVKDFCMATDNSESLVRHHPEMFEHLMVRSPARKVIFDGFRVAQAIEKGFEPLNLGPRILRTETAALAAIAALQVYAGDF